VHALRSESVSDAEAHPGSGALVAFATGLGAIDPAEHLRWRATWPRAPRARPTSMRPREPERSLDAQQLEDDDGPPDFAQGTARSSPSPRPVGFGLILGYPVYRTIEGGPHTGR
jgi:hypothetical protein